MGILTVLGIAVSLAMDAFSVSIACGARLKKLTFGHYFRLAFHFGLFQFMMPLIGYYGGMTVEKIISSYDHWIAFGLLSFIGLKMIWESLKKEETEQEAECRDPSRKMSLIMLSIATSIDAAAVGFSFAALKIPIFIPAVIIGLVCALFSAAGLFLGSRIGSIMGKWAERFGGIVLIIIGIKILTEHLN